MVRARVAGYAVTASAYDIDGRVVGEGTASFAFVDGARRVLLYVTRMSSSTAPCRFGGDV